MEDHAAAYLGSREAWEGIRPLAKMQHFKDWDKATLIDRGYDERKPESALALEDVKGAAKFRGGSCESAAMEKGDWATKLKLRCAFGHEFSASPRLVLETRHPASGIQPEAFHTVDGMRA